MQYFCAFTASQTLRCKHLLKERKSAVPGSLNPSQAELGKSEMLRECVVVWFLQWAGGWEVIEVTRSQKLWKNFFFLPLVKGVSISKDSNSVITVITTITTIINHHHHHHHHHEYQQFDCKAFAGRQVVRSSGRSACLVWWHARHILGRKSPGALRCLEGL